MSKADITLNPEAVAALKRAGDKFVEVMVTAIRDMSVNIRRTQSFQKLMRDLARLPEHVCNDGDHECEIIRHYADEVRAELGLSSRG